MSSLHEKLKFLGPVSFPSVPTSTPDLSAFLQKHFTAAQYILESIPQPATASKPSTSTARSRATSSASTPITILDINPSSARASTPSAEHEALQKDWGKPLKLSEKENPLGISVYKLSAKDGRGAWFARRSVHEGLNFERWKEGLIQEFPASLEVQGGPGEGKVRGIAAERRQEKLEVEGVGRVEVYHLSAQFPGPSAPRDFVTLLLTSDMALEEKEGAPRHYMVISKPCEHPDYPAGNGLVRGSYESIEFIREIPREKKSTSVTDLTKSESAAGPDEQEVDIARATSPSGRSRGKTISFAESRGSNAKGESIDLRDGTAEADEEETNPVEWMMITRSDPGGSVPRFLVERGTPAGIVSDASKFLDWACKREASNSTESSDDKSEEETPKAAGSQSRSEEQTAEPTVEPVAASQGLLSTAANAIQSATETYAPNVTNGLLSAASPILPNPPDTSTSSLGRTRSSSISSSDSFASAEEDFSDVASLPSSASGPTKQLSPQEKELLRLANRKSELAEKLQRTKEKSVRDKSNPTEKEISNMKKAQEKYDREVTKAEERYAKALKAIEDRRRRDTSKEEERQERELKREVERRQKAEKREREAKERAEKKEVETRLKAEIETLKKEVGSLKAEKSEFGETIRRLQAENTKLVTMMGKLSGGPRLLRELKGDSEDGGSKEGDVERSGTPHDAEANGS